MAFKATRSVAWPLRPRYTRGFLTRVSRFLGKAVSAASFGEDAGYPEMLVFFPCVTRASQECCQCIARRHRERMGVLNAEPDAGLSSLPTPSDYMSSFSTEINMFDSINIYIKAEILIACGVASSSSK